MPNRVKYRPYPHADPASVRRDHSGSNRTMTDTRIYATYRIETPHPLDKAAAVMAGEQSAGTFVKLPGETPELLEQHGARVERITELESVVEPSLPGSKRPKGADLNAPYRRAEVVLSFPFANVGTSLPTLMTTV